MQASSHGCLGSLEVGEIHHICFAQWEEVILFAWPAKATGTRYGTKTPSA